MLRRYFDQAEQLGEYVVANHDRFQGRDRDRVFKLSAGFVSKVVKYCRTDGGLSHEQLFMCRIGTIPAGMNERELTETVFLYNPDGLKGIHEVEEPITMCEGIAVATAGVMEPCHHIVVNGEVYYIPLIYVTDHDLVEVPGRTTGDL